MGGQSPMHVRSLTSMRFIAASMVVLHHLPLAMPSLLGPLALAQSGYVGVTFFFLLSGFVLTYSHTSQPDHGISLGDFYVKRFARIYPLHALTAVAMLLIALPDAPGWRAVLANLLLLQAWSPDEDVYLALVGAAWTLSCELFFYAAFPFVFTVLRRLAHPLTWAVGSAVAVAVASGVVSLMSPDAARYLYHLPAARMVEFAIGILLALAVRRGWRMRGGRTQVLGLVGGAYLAIVVVQVLGRHGPEKGWFFSLLMVIPFAALIARAAGGEIDGGNGLLRGRLPVALGQWSYAVYLVHGVVFAALAAVLRDLVGGGAMAAACAVVALVVVVSWLLHAVYERRLERLIRRTWSRRSPGRAGQPRPLAGSA